MLEYKIKIPFKRRRTNKTRYSADKLYISGAELKHTNTKLTIMLYVYNKQKLSIQQYIAKIIRVKLNKVFYKEGVVKRIKYKNRILTTLKRTLFFYKK
jgi:hypothetical protein